MESKRVVEHEEAVLHRCFRNTIELAFRIDIRIAAARMAALRILRHAHFLTFENSSSIISSRRGSLFLMPDWAWLAT